MWAVSTTYLVENSRFEKASPKKSNPERKSKLSLNVMKIVLINARTDDAADHAAVKTCDGDQYWYGMKRFLGYNEDEVAATLQMSPKISQRYMLKCLKCLR